jgi:outer membrane protein assembly factor BamB
MSSDLIYVGVKAHVAAFHKIDGKPAWRTKLTSGATSGDRFVSLLVSDGMVFAHTYGELYCLDAETGTLLWKDALDGLSYDLASLAVEGASNSRLLSPIHKKKKAAAAAATTAANSAANS